MTDTTAGELSDRRRLLSRWLMNPALSEEEAISAVANHPAMRLVAVAWCDIGSEPRTQEIGHLWLAADVRGKVFPGVFVGHRLPIDAVKVLHVPDPSATPAQPDTSAKVEAAIGELERMTGIDAVEKEAIRTVVAALRDQRAAQPDTGDVAALREAIARLKIWSSTGQKVGAYSGELGDPTPITDVRIALAALSKPNAPGAA